MPFVRLGRLVHTIMPKSQLEKLKQERRKIRRSFTKIFHEVSPYFDSLNLSDADVSALKSSLVALNSKFEQCEKVDTELEEVLLDEIEDGAELDAFFDEVDEVTFINRGKLNKLDFLVSKFDKTVAPEIAQPPTSGISLRLKLPELNLPTFDGNITEWCGFWERFQSQIGDSPDLPNSAKFTYLVGQLRGQALDTVKGIIPSDQN